MGSKLHHEWVVPASDCVAGGLSQIVALDYLLVPVPDVYPLAVQPDTTLIVRPILHRTLVAVIVEERCHQVPRHQQVAWQYVDPLLGNHQAPTPIAQQAQATSKKNRPSRSTPTAAAGNRKNTFGLVRV